MIARGSEDAASYPKNTSTAFLLTDRSTSTVLVLSCTRSFPQSSVRMPPMQKQQLCTVHTTLFLFHRTSLCKLCCLYSFARCQTADLQFCVLVSAPARGNNPSRWAPNFVCTDFLEQFSIYSRFADSCFKTKGLFFLQRLTTKDAKLDVKLMSCLARMSAWTFDSQVFAGTLFINYM